MVSPLAFSTLEFKIYPIEVTGVIPKPIPIPIPAKNRTVVIITETCIDESSLIGTFVLATAGSLMLKKKFPNPAANP